MWPSPGNVSKHEVCRKSNPDQPADQPAEPPLGGKSWTPKMLETSSITPKDDFSSHIAIISVHAGLTDRQKIDRHKAHIKTIRRQSERMAKSIEDAHYQTEEYTPKSWLSCDRDLTNKK